MINMSIKVIPTVSPLKIYPSLIINPDISLTPFDLATVNISLGLVG